MRRLAGCVAAMLAVLLAAAGGAAAHWRAYAPVDRPGPALDVPAAALAQALACPQPLAGATRDVVLMIPGTTVDPDQAYSWNWEPALRSQGIPYCTITVPNHTDGDIQVAAEYIVSAVRAIHAASGRPVVMFGWSQGASTLPRWALRFWPDIRPMVASLVGVAPLNNFGTVVANAVCAGHICAPAVWQQRAGSRLMRAVNSRRRTFPEIAYTDIYTRLDDVVTPDATGALSMLPPGPNVVNVAIQDVCPTDTSDHLTIIASPTTYALAMDAIEHPGEPASLARVHISQPCVAGTMPGVSPLAFATGELGVGLPIPQRLLTGDVPREPPLRPYVFA